MIRTSFSTLACPDWTLNQILIAAARYRYDGVELRVVSRELELWKLPEFHTAALAKTRSIIAGHGLTVTALGSSACFHSPDPSERQNNIESAMRMAELASGLGAPAIRVFGDRIQAGCTRAQTAIYVTDALDQLASRLRPMGLEVWLETHGDFAASDDVCALTRHLRSSDVGIIWDPANAFEQSGESPVISMNLAPRIRHVHLKDLVRMPGKFRYTLTGEGEFPFQQALIALRRIKFEGFVSFEWEKLWHPDLAPPEVALPHFMEWWRRQEVD